MDFRRAWILLTATIGLFSAQCGEVGGLSADVDFSAVPDKPVVIDADLTLDEGTDFERTVNGPWFIVGFTIVNGSDKEMWVVTTKFEITTKLANGVTTVYTHQIDASVTCSGIEGASRAYQVRLAPGDTFTGLDSQPTDDGLSLVQCDAGDYDSPVTRERWYIDDLPANDGGIYNVKAELVGFFIDTDGTPIENIAGKTTYLFAR